MDDLFEGILPKNEGKLIKLFGSDFLTVNKNVNIVSFVNQKNNICYIIEGKIKIIKNNYNGNNVTVETLESGDILGYDIVLNDINQYEILTVSNCELVSFDFEQVLNSNNINTPQYDKFCLNLLKCMKKRIKKNSERIEILSHKTIRNKLLSYFKININGSNSRTIYLPSTYSDLADYISVDRCAMERELKNLKDENLIEVHGKIIKLKYYPDH